MLTLSGVAKSVSGRRILDGITFEMAGGESVALLGANGSGKTTTLRCIVGLARPDAGRICIDGIDVARDPLRARARMSYLPQKPVFPGTLTVRETLQVVARLRATDSCAVDRELVACDLDSLADRNVAQLSGGERQRLAMAVAFLPRVDLYLFDEASSNLDPAALRILIGRARQLKRDGRSLLFTTHVPADVRRLATRAIVLRNGRIDSDRAGAFELTWGSAPHPGSVACGGPVPRAAPCAGAPCAPPSCGRPEQDFRNRPHNGLRRCEWLLDRDMWGEDHEDAICDGGSGDRVAVDARLRSRSAVA